MPVVLIVDDNDRNRKLARDVLQAGGFQTFEAATGAEAILLATDHVPDVVLMDLKLPDIHGTAATRALAAADLTAAIPVVAMSAMSLEGADEWLAEAGFAGSIGKPIDVGMFAEQVRHYCAHGE